MVKLKTLKDAMINLIKKSAEFEESFIFERLQEYMDLSDPTNPKWNSNVRIRMVEIHEAVKFEKQKQKAEAIKIAKVQNEFLGLADWLEFFNITKEDLK